MSIKKSIFISLSLGTLVLLCGCGKSSSDLDNKDYQNQQQVQSVPPASRNDKGGSYDQQGGQQNQQPFAQQELPQQPAQQGNIAKGGGIGGLNSNTSVSTGSQVQGVQQGTGTQPQ